MTYPELMEAVQALATVCDGAATEDAQGFNGLDTAFGRSLARQGSWSKAQAVAAYKMLRKYRNTQLPGFGIDYDAIPDPAETDPDAGPDGPRPTGHIVMDGERLALSFDYDRELVDQVRALQGRNWDSSKRCWLVDPTFTNVHAVFELAQNSGWEIDDDAMAVMERVSEAGPSDEDLPQPNIQVDRDDDGEPTGFVIKFDYDPARVAEVKSNVTGRRWDGERKVWTAPLSELAARELVAVAKATGMTFDDEAEDVARTLVDKAEALQVASRLEDAELEVDGLGGEGMTLMPFQRAGVAYAASTKRCIIGDEMGLGKTVQALAAIQYTDGFPALVLCPASVKLNWVREIQKWLPGRSVDYLAAKGEPMGTQPDLLVVNYDLLSNLKGKKSPALKSLMDADFQSLVIDEVHYAKNPKAQRTKAVAKLADNVPDDGLVLGLSGTPIKNRPVELVTPLKILGHFDRMFGSWVSYVRRYCAGYKDNFGWQVNGSSNLTELNERLRGTCMIRRLKRDVQKELPEKARRKVAVPMSDASEYRRAEADVVSYFADRKAADSDFLESIAHLSPTEQQDAKKKRRAEKKASAEQAEALVRINTLRELVGRLKLDAVVDWVRDFIDGTDSKLVLFAHHINVQSGLLREFEDVAVAIRGGDAATARQEAIDRFVEDDDIRLFVGSIGAAGTGVDLLQRAASDVAFVEFAWTPGDMQQAEDRVHRMGQDSDAVTVWHLVADDTIDDYMQEQLAEKQAVLDAALGDGDEDAAASARGQSVMRAVVGSLLQKGA